MEHESEMTERKQSREAKKIEILKEISNQYF